MKMCIIKQFHFITKITIPINKNNFIRKLTNCKDLQLYLPFRLDKTVKLNQNSTLFEFVVIVYILRCIYNSVIVTAKI